jgi:hypothetical protein
VVSKKRRATAPDAESAGVERGQREGQAARAAFIGVVVLLLVGIVVALFSASQPVSPATAGIAPVSNADRIEVVYFHRTERCAACLWVEQVARKVVESSFAPQIASRKVTYREVDVQKPENRAMAAKYRAGGSQLFVNYIKDGRDGIVEAYQTYPFVGNEARFSELLRSMIASGFGQS